ncbi:geranylgeranyl reductase family protein [Nanoarchaeota archaeon]
MNITIIGAGPVGSYAAYLFAKKGFKVHLFDRKKTNQIGKPVQCTGIFSSEIKKFVSLKEDFLVNTTNHIQIISPNNRILTLNKEEYVFNREKFDKYLLDLAIKEGVKFHSEHKLTKIVKNSRNKIDLVFNNKNKTIVFSSNIVIGADGPLSLVYKYLNKNKKKKFYYGIQAVINGKFDSKAYQVYFGKKVCSNFFSWVVPESKTKARIGLATKKAPKFYFDRFLQRLNIKQNQIIEKQGGIIPIFDSKIKTNHKNIFLLGDSASHLKATTGGGIIPAFQEARNLVYRISKNKPYQSNFRNLKRHLLIRKILNKFSDKDYDRLIYLLSKPRNKKIIETHSRENPKKLIRKLIFQEPRLLSFVKYLF